MFCYSTVDISSLKIAVSDDGVVFALVYFSFFFARLTSDLERRRRGFL